MLETAFLNQQVDVSRLNVPIEAEIDPAEVEKVAEILRIYEDRFAFPLRRWSIG